MTDKFYKELKAKSKNGIVFQILVNGEWVVCENISILPFKDKTLGEYIEQKEKAYNDKLDTLEKALSKQQEQIRLLTDALKKLNGGVK